jgi:CRP/FNR family transcriptional regulator, cyclic AMP receptor protein
VTEEASYRLDGIELLAGLPAETLRGLERRSRWRRYRDGEQILDRHSDDRDVYFVVKGTVEVVAFSMTGREIAFALVKPGGFFGELAAIDGGARSASVVAAGECLLASLAPSVFTGLCEEHPAVALHVMRRLARIVRTCDERIMDLSTLGAVQRVYVELLRLAEPVAAVVTIGGKAPPPSYVIRDMPTHKDIASRVSTTRETVARAVSHLTSANIIEKKGRLLHIRDRAMLEHLAGALDPELPDTR